MKLKEVIIDYSKKYLDGENSWYSWKKINESKIPAGIVLKHGNQYLKNIDLKRKLHEHWVNEKTSTKKGEYIQYYISDWGGIRTNSNDSMIEYMTLSPEKLIDKGKKGIASWSKALVVHNPDKYAIFDARVAISLNCIQSIYNTDKKMLFPILSSRNKIIANANKLIKNQANIEKWVKTNESDFYIGYLNLLNDLANTLESDISTVEMLLFAKAEELAIENFSELNQ